MKRGQRARLVILGILKVVAFIVSMRLLRQLVFIPLVALSAKYWAKYDGRGLNEPWFLSSSIALLLVTIFLCFIFIRFIDKKDWSYIRLRSDNKFKLFVIGILLSFVIVLLFTAVTIIFDAIEINIKLKSLNNILFYLILAFIGTFVLVLNEELISRGYVLKTLESHFNTIFAVIISSFLFSLYHIFRPDTSLLGFFNIFLMGCFVALICVYSNSLWLPIGLHFGWNYSLYLLNFPVSGHTYPNPIFSLKYNEHSLLTGSKFGPEDSIIMTILLSIAVAYIFVKFRKRVNSR